MKTVTDYNMEEKLKFLRGMCFNNASTLIAGSFAGGDVKLVSAEAIFNYAQVLFDEAIRRNWLEYGKITDNREINKETGKVEIIMTEKEGREMDKDYQDEDMEKESELVI